MFDTAHYYNSPDKKPDCDKHAGSDNWYSNICLCLMSNGVYELLTYLEFDDGEKWNDQCGNNVVAWMELY